MRQTWLGNEQKHYPWHLTDHFSKTSITPKRSEMDSKYESQWHGMMLISNKESRSRSPIDKERHGSISSRIIEPSLQDPIPSNSRKKPSSQSFASNQASDPSDSQQAKRSSSRKKYEVNGKALIKNSYSPCNPMISNDLESKYRDRSLTPQPGLPRSSKKTFEKGQADRLGNIMNDKLPPKPAKVLKPDFVSHIATLPGGVKAEFAPEPPGSVEALRPRQLVRTQPREDRPRKRKPSNENEQWRSSFDIIRHVISSKTYY